MAHATAGPERIAAPARLIFIDNLRWVMIVLVITMHAAVTYSNLGRWYYNEHAVLTLPTRLFFIVWQTSLQAFFMGLLFFIAGYFTPPAFDRKGPARFLRDRAIRLGIPSLLYMFVIAPLTIYYLLPAKAIRPAFPHWWLHYARDPDTGPLWFCVALLIFCPIYALIRGLAGKSIRARQWLPADRQVLLFIVVMAVATWSVRVVQPIGTAIWNMQLCYFSQYVLLFIAGIYAYRNGWLLRLSRDQAKLWSSLALVIGGLWFAILLACALAYNWGDRVLGGLHWQSAVLCGWESFFCVGVCLGLIVLFRERLNAQPPLARFLSDNAFAVYVFHPPVVIGAALALRALSAPPVAKFAIVSAIGILVSFPVAAVLRQVPLLKRVL